MQGEQVFFEAVFERRQEDWSWASGDGYQARRRSGSCQGDPQAKAQMEMRCS